jgi:HEAT repeat protein
VSVKDKSFTQQAKEYVSLQIKWRTWGAAIGLLAALVVYGFRLVGGSPAVDDRAGRPNAAEPAEATPQQSRREAQIEFALGRLNHESLTQQCDAAIILARLKSAEAIAPLREMLRRTDVDPYVQTCAARALTTLGDGDVARGYYREWLQSDNIHLFDFANKAYQQLGPEAAAEAMPSLTIVARSDSRHRKEILRTLAAIGPEAEPLLTELATDSDPWVKKKATEALATLK